MIYSVRKELKKWKLALWPVLISLAASSLFVARRSTLSSYVMHVNGEGVEYREFISRVHQFQDQLNQLKSYARSSGMDVETFLRLFGIHSQDPVQMAVDGLTHERLINAALRSHYVMLSDDVVSAELFKSLPGDVVRAGYINHEAYRLYLAQRHTTIREYEDRKEDEIRQVLFDDFVNYAGYASRFRVRTEIEEKIGKKSFSIVKVSRNDGKGSVNQSISEDDKASYYQEHAEKYRVPEKRDISYWVIDPIKAESKVDVSDESIERFYEKNRTSLYRIPPKVKVRSLVLKDEKNGEQRIYDLLKQAHEDKNFEALVAEHSQVSSAVRDYFSSGTYDKEFEKAAFRLKAVGDLSPVVKTDRGFEILQLVDRIASSEKPLSDVRVDVAKAVRGKKAAEWLKNSLEKVRREGNKSDKFAELTQLASESKQLLKVDRLKAASETIEGTAIEHGFSLGAEGSCASFSRDNKSVLVVLRKKEASFIPEFTAVKKKVEKDLLDDRARAQQKTLVELLSAEVRDGNMMDVVAKKYKLSYQKTVAVSATDTDKAPFNAVEGMLKKAFSLQDESQLLTITSGDDLYVVQLMGTDLDDADSDAADVVLLGGEISHDSSQVSRAFVASLRRSAKIDLDQKILATKQEPIGGEPIF